MSWLPIDNRNVQGAEGHPYTLNVFCPAPGCPNEASERHHLWRRSFLNGDFWWVTLPDGETVGNCVRLCNQHHAEITTNRSKIEYDDGRFFWNTMVSARQLLGWQPPFLGEDPQTEQITHVHTEKETCPTCLRPMPKPKLDTPVEERKVRVTWAVRVPKDVQEDGAEVLDALVEAARDLLAAAGLPYGDTDAVKYHVLSTSLALFVQHGKEIL